MSQGDNKGIVGEHYGLAAIVNTCVDIERRTLTPALCWMTTTDSEKPICKYQQLDRQGILYACNKYAKKVGE